MSEMQITNANNSLLLTRTRQNEFHILYDLFAAGVAITRFIRPTECRLIIGTLIIGTSIIVDGGD